MNPTGYWLSEKMDGCRVFLTESGALLTRNGKRWNPPEWFMQGMPRGVRLDGELFTQRGDFDGLVSAVQRKRDPWQGVRFLVFDLATLRMPIERRHAALARLQLPPWVELLPHRVCRSQEDLDAEETAIVRNGGEGVCLRAPGSTYKPFGYVKIKRLHPDLNRSILD
jgi:DNA ligase-1